MKKVLLILVLLLIAGVAAYIAFTGSVKPKEDSPTSSPQTPKDTKKGSFLGNTDDSLIASNNGKILCLLLGIEGCPGTKKSTPILDQLSREYTDHAFVRTDVPNSENYKPVQPWNHRIDYSVDKDRKLAKKLDFFFYPTLYIFDKNGELRYEGACELEEVKKIITAIDAEKPGDEKQVFSPIPLELGTQAPSFEIVSGDKKTTLEDLLGKKCTLLFFSTSTCPYCLKELENIAKLQDGFAEQGVNITIIDQEKKSAKSEQIYKKAVSDASVIFDDSKKIFPAYVVGAVPYYFLLNKSGEIVARGNFDVAKVIEALENKFALSASGIEAQSSGAG